jgi:DNA primase
MYHCYGCGAGGDMFTFIQEIEKVDFKQALKILAEKANVELTPVSPEKKSERDRLYAVLEAAANFYQKRLEANASAKTYLDNRGVVSATIGAWRIGFAPGPPEGWAVLRDALRQEGYTDTELFKAGLIKESDKGKEPYDVFRNRVMFPLFDSSGRVVAFSGRTLEVGDDIPKYVNSPETELFKKSELLYGYDKAKHGIRNLGFSMIVEGQFDVVMSHQAGYGNTVAVSGTALTAQHVQLLERLSSKVVLALDSDRAGIAAVKKAADLMLRRGMDVKVAKLEGGKDPADVIKHDQREFKHMIGKSVHVIEFLLEVLVAQDLDDRAFKLRARDEVLPYVLLLPNYIDQDHFEGKVAEVLKTTKEAIHSEVERMRDKAESVKEVVYNNVEIKKRETVSVPDLKQRYTTDLTYLIGLLPLFTETIKSKIIKELETVTGEEFVVLQTKPQANALAEVLFKKEDFLDKNPRKVFDDEYVHRLNVFRNELVRSRLKQLKEEQQRLKEMGDGEGELALMGEALTLQRSLQQPALTVEFIKS